MGADFESNSESLRSCSGAKDMSASASCCCRNKRSTIIKGGGWNCPHCYMGSPRHWNVRRHILRLHDGLGEPVNGFGKTREQCQMDMNLQFGHGNYHNSQKYSSFVPVQFKESRFSSSTPKDRMRNNNKLRWDFMDEIIEPAKKFLEFTRVLEELSMSNHRLSRYCYYPSAISHQYPVYLSPPISGSSIGSMNAINSSSTSNMTNKTIDNEITRTEVTKRQLFEHGVSSLQSIISSPSVHWWEHNQRTPPSKVVCTTQ